MEVGIRIVESAGLIQNIWDFTGDSDRAHVNQMLFAPSNEKP